MADLRPQEGQAAQGQTSRQQRRQEGVRWVKCKPRMTANHLLGVDRCKTVKGECPRALWVQPTLQMETEAYQPEGARSPSESLAELKQTLLCLSISKTRASQVAGGAQCYTQQNWPVEFMLEAQQGRARARGLRSQRDQDL